MAVSEGGGWSVECRRAVGGQWQCRRAVGVSGPNRIAIIAGIT